MKTVSRAAPLFVSLALASLASLAAPTAAFAQSSARAAGVATRTQALTPLRHIAPSGPGETGLHDPQQIVVRDEAAWRALWTSVHAGYGATPPPPPVDFRTEMVVLVNLGEVPTSAMMGVRVTGATIDAHHVLEVRVRVTQSHLPANVSTTADMQTPMDLAVLPRFDDAVVFTTHVVSA